MSWSKLPLKLKEIWAVRVRLQLSRNHNDRDSGWQYEALSGAIELGPDDNHARVQPDGAYLSWLAKGRAGSPGRGGCQWLSLMG